MGGMGPTLHLLYALRYYQRAISPSDICRVKPTDGIYMLMNAAGDCFLLFPAADS